jgi:hypothetical protein
MCNRLRNAILRLSTLKKVTNHINHTVHNHCVMNILTVIISTKQNRVITRQAMHAGYLPGAFTKPLFPCKSKKCYIFLCVCMRARFLVRAYMSACMGGCARGVCLPACSFAYLARNIHAPYCHLWPRWLHHIFRHYLINGKIFLKMLLNIKSVFWFSIQFCINTFYSNKNSERYCHKYANVFMWSTRYSFYILMKLWLFWQILKEAQIWDFIKIRRVVAELFLADGQTDARTGRCDESNSGFCTFQSVIFFVNKIAILQIFL